MGYDWDAPKGDGEPPPYREAQEVDRLDVYVAETERMEVLLRVAQADDLPGEGLGSISTSPARVAAQRLLEMVKANQRFLDG